MSILKGWMTPKRVMHFVNGEELAFYPLSSGLLFRLKSFIRPIMQTLSSLFEKDANLVAQDIEQFVDSEHGVQSAKTSTKGIPVDLYEARAQRKDKGVASLVDSLLDDKTMMILGEVIMDSLREEFPRQKGQNSHPADAVQEFIHDIDLVVLKDLLFGVFKANGKALGPFAEEFLGDLRGMIQGRFESVSAQLKNTQGYAPQPDQNPQSEEDQDQTPPSQMSPSGTTTDSGPP